MSLQDQNLEMTLNQRMRARATCPPVEHRRIDRSARGADKHSYLQLESVQVSGRVCERQCIAQQRDNLGTVRSQHRHRQRTAASREDSGASARCVVTQNYVQADCEYNSSEAGSGPYVQSQREVFEVELERRMRATGTAVPTEQVDMLVRDSGYQCSMRKRRGRPNDAYVAVHNDVMQHGERGVDVAAGACVTDVDANFAWQYRLKNEVGSSSGSENSGLDAEVIRVNAVGQTALEDYSERLRLVDWEQHKRHSEWSDAVIRNGAHAGTPRARPVFAKCEWPVRLAA